MGLTLRSHCTRCPESKISVDPPSLPPSNLLFRWSRHCPDLLDELPAFADSSKVEGYLDFVAAGNESLAGSIAYRIPGTEYKYKCGPGFELPSRTNPERYIRCQGSRKMEVSEVSVLCVPKVCEDQPDTGDAAGIGSHDWDDSVILESWFLYSCPFGKAFAGNYTQQLNNTCDLHTAGSSVPRWKYNADFPLPNCIRKLRDLWSPSTTLNT